MKRRFMFYKIDELERLFLEGPADTGLLQALEAELRIRKTPRATTLFDKVSKALQADSSSPNEIDENDPAKPGAASDVPDINYTSNRPLAPLLEAVVVPPSKPAPSPPHAPAVRAEEIGHAPVAPAMPISEAYKHLGSKPGESWESIELKRRQLVQESSPFRTLDMTPDKREKKIEIARRANEAHSALAWHRRHL